MFSKLQVLTCKITFKYFCHMSKVRLALPECKYRNDADELLKDQFIFGIYNKEIQDHPLGEIKEMDNSVKSLYEARKIESKLAQRKLLRIVTPTAISVETIKKGFKDGHRDLCDYCGCSHRKGKRNCPAFGKICDKCGGKNHFKTVCKSESKRDSTRRPDGAIRKNSRKCSHRCNVHEIEECHDDSLMEDLNEQVQSLFYS